MKMESDAKPLFVVARDGVEPPTPAFQGLYSVGLTPFSINKFVKVAPVL